MTVPSLCFANLALIPLTEATPVSVAVIPDFGATLKVIAYSLPSEKVWEVILTQASSVMSYQVMLPATIV